MTVKLLCKIHSCYVCCYVDTF